MTPLGCLRATTRCGGRRDPGDRRRAHRPRRARAAANSRRRLTLRYGGSRWTTQPCAIACAPWRPRRPRSPRRRRPRCCSRPRQAAPGPARRDALSRARRGLHHLDPRTRALAPSLFLALCRRYGLKPHRHARQRRATVVVAAPPSFYEGVLWPEFQVLSDALYDAFLSRTTGALREVLACWRGGCHRHARRGTVSRRAHAAAATSIAFLCSAWARSVSIARSARRRAQRLQRGEQVLARVHSVNPAARPEIPRSRPSARVGAGLRRGRAHVDGAHAAPSPAERPRGRVVLVVRSPSTQPCQSVSCSRVSFARA